MLELHVTWLERARRSCVVLFFSVNEHGLAVGAYNERDFKLSLNLRALPGSESESPLVGWVLCVGSYPG